MLHTIWGPGMELREEELLRREMQQAAELKVPLEIDLHRGNNWYEAK